MPLPVARAAALPRTTTPQASTTMPRLAYRSPFAMIGYKGAAPGTAMLALEKTKVLLRMEAEFTATTTALAMTARSAAPVTPAAIDHAMVVEVKMQHGRNDKVNVTELILAGD
jgi:hypothetical protein